MKKIFGKITQKLLLLLKFVGFVQSRILFFFVYLIIVTPLGAVIRFTQDPLKQKVKFPRWTIRNDTYNTFDSLRKQ